MRKFATESAKIGETLIASGTPGAKETARALLHHIDVDVLRGSFFGLKKSAAPGVDEMTWAEYAETLEANLIDLHARVHTGAYRALPSRRRYIPKADGRLRWHASHQRPVCGGDHRSDLPGLACQ